MTETIGKVTLDYTFYPGEDYYCDGSVEDEILEVVKNNPPADFPKFIEEKHSWEYLYHLSYLRENIISWLPMGPDTRVLEVGSGMGAITGWLAQNAGHVDCVDLSRKRSLINAYRNSEYDNVTIHVGNFNDIEPTLSEDYDYVLLIGVFEYGQSYIPTATPFEDFLKINRRHVKKGGNLIIAIENKMGMKYWAGCQEDHLGTWFSGIEDYADGGGVRTFTRGGLERILKTCQVEDYSFYYPYPDYKFPTILFSDDRLPQVGELSHNLRNFDRDRMLLFDEKKAFDMVIREGLFPLYSNSYLLITGPKPDTIYTKFSNDRADIYAIRTDILEKDGIRSVRKYPAVPAACEHIENLAKSCLALKDRYLGSRLHVNACRLIRKEGCLPYVELEYLKGKTLAELMDETLDRDGAKAFEQLFEEYLDAVACREEVPVSDYDLIFANIIVGEDGKWTLIDYEWTFDERVDTKALAFRALYCYLLENGKRKACEPDKLRERLGITPDLAEEYRQRERRFQKAVTGSRISISDMRVMIGKKAIPYEEFFNRAERKKVQIFEDYGKGYTPEQSYYLFDTYEADDLIHFKLPVREGVCGIRIDPAEVPCIIRVRRISLDGRRLPAEEKSVLAVNGWELDDKEVKKEPHPVFFFNTGDPNVNIRLDSVPHEGGETLEVEMEVAWLTGEAAAALDINLKRRNHKWF